MKKKKILVFHPIIAPYRIDFFNEISRRFDAKICLSRRNLLNARFDYDKILEQFAFTPTWIVREELGTLGWLWAIWKKLCEEKPEVVMLSEFGLTALVSICYELFRNRHCKLVSSVDDSYNMVAEGNQFSYKHVLATKLMVRFMWNIINVDPRVVQYYQKNYRKGVYFPIICDDDIARHRLQRILPLSEELVKKYALEGKKVLLFVGRLVALKNVDLMIRAFKQVASADTAFLIVGNGEEWDALQQEAKGCDSIHFVGRKEGDELYAFYNIAQIFILASRQEAFGAVTNEALQGGCYSLVSEKAGSSCLIEKGKNGNVISVGNERDIADSLKFAFAKVERVHLPLELRPNGMRETFRTCFERMLQELDL